MGSKHQTCVSSGRNGGGSFLAGQSAWDFNSPPLISGHLLSLKEKICQGPGPGEIKVSAPRRRTHAFNAGSGPGRIKEMASPVLEKQRVPWESMWADRTPEDPLGAGRRRGEGDGGRGFPVSDHLAAALSAFGRARPPPARSRAGVAPAPSGPAPCTSGQQPETHLPSQPRHRSLSVKQAELCRVAGPGRLRPASSPSAGQSGDGYATDGAWSCGL